jgi:hypothetical protein
MSKNEYIFGKEPEPVITKMEPTPSKRPISKGNTLREWVENVPRQVSHGECLFGNVDEKKVPASNNPIMPDKIQSRYSSAYIRREKPTLIRCSNDKLFDNKDVVEIPEPRREMIEATQRKKKNTSGIIAHGESLFGEPEQPQPTQETLFEEHELVQGETLYEAVENSVAETDVSETGDSVVEENEVAEDNVAEGDLVENENEDQVEAQEDELVEYEEVEVEEEVEEEVTEDQAQH